MSASAMTALMVRSAPLADALEPTTNVRVAAFRSRVAVPLPLMVAPEGLLAALKVRSPVSEAVPEEPRAKVAAPPERPPRVRAEKFWLTDPNNKVPF